MKTLPLEPVTVPDPIAQEARILHCIESSRMAANAGIDNQRHSEAVNAALLKLDLVLAELGYPEVKGLSTDDGSPHLLGRELLKAKTGRFKGVNLDTVPVGSFRQEPIPAEALEKVSKASGLNFFNELRVGAYSRRHYLSLHEESVISYATPDRFLIGVVNKIMRDNELISSIFSRDGDVKGLYFGLTSLSDGFYMNRARFFLIDQWQVAPQ